MRVLFEAGKRSFIEKGADGDKAARREVDDAKEGERRLCEDDSWDHENARGREGACRIWKDVPEDESRILRA